LSCASEPDYPERVYAGVLGKLIGVYLGRPFEGWTHARIEAELGEIRGYVHGHPAIDPGRRDNPLVQPDDDISGTFTFLRALEDHGPEATAEQIGRTWLDYLVEERSTLWWGGRGLSTEHTAYLRLKRGEPPAAEPSVLTEQIGAQIFVDGWAMVAPGDPERAAELARRAASVSHAGEAVLAAQAIAAMEAQAFVEPRIDRLLDTAVDSIAAGSLVARVIADLREWHAAEPDWRRARARVEARYGYDRYGGGCHVIPNHALVVLGLLYGEGDFARSLGIVNTCGWDTDCNSGNLGCLLGIRNGLAGIAARWRDPVRDRLYVSSADGGRAVSDAVAETRRIVRLAGAAMDGPRFSFPFPGSVQGFTGEHVDGALAVSGRAMTATFTPPEAVRFMDEDLLAAPWLHPGGYALVASPTLYPGQTLRAHVRARTDVRCRPAVAAYDGRGALRVLRGPERVLAQGEAAGLAWVVPGTGGQPIAQVGLEAEDGTVLLDWLTWDGAPDCRLGRPADGGAMWRRAWVPGVDRFESPADAAFRLIQNEGRGLLSQGTREWTDYEVSATVTPAAVVAAGIAARVQGLRRGYALLLGDDHRARLVKLLDGDTVLAEAPCARPFGVPVELRLRVAGPRIEARANGEPLFAVEDADLAGGAAAFVCEAGCMSSDGMAVRP
jgi:ADP-ribosylglycohydrolase